MQQSLLDTFSENKTQIPKLNINTKQIKHKTKNISINYEKKFSKGYVYLISNELYINQGIVKIGRTIDFDKRLQNLNNTSAYNWKILLLLQHDQHELLEKELHTHTENSNNQAKHIKREFFKVTKQYLTFLKKELHPYIKEENSQLISQLPNKLIENNDKIITDTKKHKSSQKIKQKSKFTKIINENEQIKIEYINKLVIKTKKYKTKTHGERLNPFCQSYFPPELVDYIQVENNLLYFYKNNQNICITGKCPEEEYAQIKIQKANQFSIPRKFFPEIDASQVIITIDFSIYDPYTNHKGLISIRLE